jgi:Zn ribbon nucleic-acid-binding protein
MDLEEKKKKYKYVYGIGRSSLNLPESDIRYAMENTKSNAAAAQFLKVCFTTYKKYAKMYIDRDSGLSLFELHKNMSGVGIRKHVPKASKGMYSIERILNGDHPEYPTWKLRNRLLALGIFEEQCVSCGYAERRVTDDTVPLLLDHIDGDKTNHQADNLQMLCLNCYYQQSGNPFNVDKEVYWNYNILD